jgi:membrane dipeptidase
VESLVSLAWAARLGVSQQAVELVEDADFIDLHQTTEVPVRLYGYDPEKHHPRRKRPNAFFGHCDFPRLALAGYTGVFYDITTNPLRGSARSLELTTSNVRTARTRLDNAENAMHAVRDIAGYLSRPEGTVAAWLSLQGGDAIAHDPTALDGWLGEQITRITLVHMTRSRLGGTSSPLGKGGGITPRGAEVIEAMAANRILLDLAHASRETFWDALDAHTGPLPPIVSHTGVCGVRDIWRNLDDDQLRAIADRGGVIGILYHSPFLEPVVGHGKLAAVVAHISHVVDVVGEESVAIGSDYDGMILPPRDLPDITDHPLLVQQLFDVGYSEARIRKVLGENALRVIAAI